MPKRYPELSEEMETLVNNAIASVGTRREDKAVRELEEAIERLEEQCRRQRREANA